MTTDIKIEDVQTGGSRAFTTPTERPMTMTIAHLPSRWLRLSYILLTAFVCLSGQTANANPKQEFLKLEGDMEEATDTFFEALANLADNNGQGVVHDPAKLPTDLRPAILKKMDALAAKHADSPDGGYIAGHTFLWAIDIEPNSLLDRFEILVKRFPHSEVIVYALESVPFVYQESGQASQWTKWLDRLAIKTENAEAKFSSLLAAGRIHMAAGENNAATMALKKLQAVTAKAMADIKPGSDKDEALYAADYQKLAKGLIYELEHLQVGMAAPTFSTKTVDGKEISLKSLRGKVVLLDFWATWCGPCVAEIPNLKKAVKALQGKPFEILAVAIDEDKQGLEQLIKAIDAPGIHTWDPKGSENPVGLLYNVERLPTWYLVDQQGIIQARDPDSEKLADLVKSLLNTDAVAKDKTANHATGTAAGR